LWMCTLGTVLNSGRGKESSQKREIKGRGRRKGKIQVAALAKRKTEAKKRGGVAVVKVLT